jgi:hypothetical protein
LAANEYYSRMQSKPWLIATVIAVIIAAVAVFLRTPSEPAYQGKPLTHWLRGWKPLIAIPLASAGNAPTSDEAESAMRAIGTNALPTLLRMMEHHDSPLKDRLLSLAQKIPFLRMEPVSPLDLNVEAEMAFNVLGPKAGPAVSKLIEIYNRESDLLTKNYVLRALAHIGPPAEPAVPMLLRAISGTNALSLRGNAIYALGSIHAEAANVVPALISCLADPEPGFCRGAILCFEPFRPRCKGGRASLAGVDPRPKTQRGLHFRQVSRANSNNGRNCDRRFMGNRSGRSEEGRNMALAVMGSALGRFWIDDWIFWGARASRTPCLASRQTHLVPAITTRGHRRIILMLNSYDGEREGRRETRHPATETVALPQHSGTARHSTENNEEQKSE